MSLAFRRHPECLILRYGDACASIIDNAKPTSKTKHSMNQKTTPILIILLVMLTVVSARATLYSVSAKVRDKATGVVMTDAVYRMLEMPDSIVVKTGETVTTWLSGSSDNWTHHTSPEFTVGGLDTDKRYVLEITSSAHEPLYVEIDPSGMGKRESVLNLGYLELKKAYRLDELTVTATKVKFYNKGDTIIYNADAFQLAEGSMLDVLISQLPGAELNDNGQIFVNGRQVESLLLNSKDFFKGDNKIMLENLGAYTVKNIAVYEGQKEEDRIIGKDYGKKQLTMDVRLKKEYNRGFIFNAEAGYGIKDKFLGRLFGLWYDDRAHVGFFGNANNNSNTWNPSQNGTSSMPSSGAKDITTYSGGVDYDVAIPRSPMSFSGNATATYTKTKQDSRTYTTNFLTGGDTYGYSFGNSRLTSLQLNTEHSVKANTDRWNWQITPKFKYLRNTTESRLISATFTREWDDIDRSFLEGIYSGDSRQVLSSMINRNVNDMEESGNNEYFNIWSNGKRKVNSTDAVTYLLAYTYDRKHTTMDETLLLNYGDDPLPVLDERRHNDVKPDSRWVAKGSVGYVWAISRTLYADIYYEYQRSSRHTVSRLYREEGYLEQAGGSFDHLTPSAVDNFGTLDVGNSFDSRYNEETHDLNFNFNYKFKGLALYVQLPFSLRRQWLHYLRGDVDARLKRNKFFPGNFSLSANINYDEKRPVWIYIGYDRKVTSPDMVDMVDFTNDLDPLNIRKGNPALKDADSENLRVYYNQTLNKSRNMKHNYGLEGTIYRNSLAYGYSYDRATGVKTGRMYNVMGNAEYSASQGFNTDFGRMNCMSVGNRTALRYNRSADMLSSGSAEPTKNIVNSYSVGEMLTLSYSHHGFKLTGEAYVNWKRFTSAQTGFIPFGAWDMRYTLSGNFKLPANFAINTDFNIYARRGYSEPYLNRNNYVWNARLSYSMLKDRLIWMIDGFDIFHNLSNVSYAVNAQARTETYAGVVPRYFMLHVQWKFHKAPLKK